MSGESGAERRRDLRVDAIYRVEVTFPSLQGFVEGYSENISHGGIFIRCESPLEAETLLRFRLKLADGETLIRGTGIVVWAREAGGSSEPGMGVRFVTMDRHSRDLIELLIEKHSLSGVLGGVPIVPGEPPRTRVAAQPVSPPVDPVPVVGDPGTGLAEHGQLTPTDPPASAPATGGEQEPVFEQPPPERPAARARHHRRLPLPWLLFLVYVGAAVVVLAYVWLRPGEEGQPADSSRPASSPSAAVAPTEAPASLPPASPPPAAAGEPADPVEPEAVAASIIEEISWQRRDGATLVVIRGDGSVLESNVSLVSLSDPPRVLIRVRGIAEGYTQDEVAVGSPELDRVRIGHHPELDPPELFVVLDLSHGGVKVIDLTTSGTAVGVKLK